MYCESCGKNIPDESRFCEYCGSKVITESEIYSKAAELSDVKVEEMVMEEEIMISKNITKSAAGSYNWMYEFSLWKNPAILITSYKVLLISSLFPALLMFFLALEDGIINSFQVLLSVLGIVVAALTVLLAIAYVVLGFSYGGKYYVLFKMDDKGVNHIQLDKQYKKAQALGFLTALIGVSSGNISAAGAGLLGASRKNLYTNFKKVKYIKIYNKKNTIYLNESLIKNQIYATKEDFQFVKQFILENCPKKIKIVEK